MLRTNLRALADSARRPGYSKVTWLPRDQVRRGGLVLAVVLALALLAFPKGGVGAAVVAVPGATITVTTTGDTLDAGGGNCAAITIASLPGPDGVTSLREAICAANNTAGDDIVTFGVNGTFTLTRAGVNEDANATGDLDVLSNITITGNGTGNTIIDGNNTDRVLDIDPLQNCNCTDSVSGVTVRNGHVNPAAINLGAGIATGLSSFVTLS